MAITDEPEQGLVGMGILINAEHELRERAQNGHRMEPGTIIALYVGDNPRRAKIETFRNGFDMLLFEPDYLFLSQNPSYYYHMGDGIGSVRYSMECLSAGDIYRSSCPIFGLVAQSEPLDRDIQPVGELKYIDLELANLVTIASSLKRPGLSDQNKQVLLRSAELSVRMLTSYELLPPAMTAIENYVKRHIEGGDALWRSQMQTPATRG